MLITVWEGDNIACTEIPLTKYSSTSWQQPLREHDVMLEGPSVTMGGRYIYTLSIALGFNQAPGVW